METTLAISFPGHDLLLAVAADPGSCAGQLSSQTGTGRPLRGSMGRLSEAALGAKYGKSRTWGRNRISEVKDGRGLAAIAG
jgi:hypothetical protein